jgi:hypothetical protein
MTPSQKIKWLILDLDRKWQGYLPLPYPCENIDELFDEHEELTDAINELRGIGMATNIPAPFSRHYERDSVALQLPDCTFVGWTYWYGGGKHGNAEEIDWIDTAYDVELVSTKEIVTVKYTFAKK